MTTRNNLAVAYQEADRAADAIPLFERNLEDLQRLLGSEPPDVVNARTTCARLDEEVARVR